jgi:hypothetical protein
MSQILQIYKDYKITQTLQLHQLRVAAVAQQVCDNLTVSVDTEIVITACLIHDMGNILKFVFTAPDEWFAPEGKVYWQQVQKEMAKKYKTTNEHELSLMIAKELKVKDQVLTCIESIDFGKTLQTVSGPTIEPKICDYADLRVNPYGVVSLDRRLDEGNKRYKKRPNYWLTDDIRDKIVQACHDNEDYLFSVSKIKPTDITDESVAPIIEQLKSYEI